MDPALKTRTISELRRRIGELSPRLQAAAKYILDNDADFGLDPIRETARKAHVSSYTFVRLARAFGFDGFDALRAPFRHALVTLTPSLPDAPFLERWRDGDGQDQIAAAANALAIVTRSIERQSPDRLRAAVDAMIGARTVYVTAMRASYGLAHTFRYVGRMALKSIEIVPRHMSSAIDDLNDAGPGDVLFAMTFTPYSHETIEAMAFARSRGLRLILLSDSDVVAPGLDADHVLQVSTNSTHHLACTAGAMAVLEILLAMLVERAGPEAQARIAGYEALRRDHRAYWPTKKTSVFR